MKDQNHNKKMVAPVIITVLFLFYLVVYAVFVAMAGQISPAFFLLAIPLIALGTAMICVLQERIKEIKKGEEDDLSNY